MGIMAKAGAKGLVAVGLLVVVLLAITLIVVTVQKPTEQRQTDSVLSASEVVKGFKLSTLTYRYTNVINQNDVQKIGDFEIPFTQTYLVVQYDGVMEIGIDGERINVDQGTDAITITLPAAEILSHTQVAGTTSVVDIGNLFNSNEIEDYVELFDAGKSELEQKVVDSGMLYVAEENAREQLRNLFNSIPGIRDNYTLIFE